MEALHRVQKHCALNSCWSDFEDLQSFFMHKHTMLSIKKKLQQKLNNKTVNDFAHKSHTDLDVQAKV